VVVREEIANDSKAKTAAKDIISEASLHGHLKNEDDANGKEEESGSLSYVNPDKANDTQLAYALDLLHGVKSAASDGAKKSADVK
jgi:carboxyl-terminal processing protease